MSINGIRFRTEGALVVLQVQEYVEGDHSPYYGQSSRATVAWRDAKVEDMLDVARYTAGNGLAERLDSLEQRVDSLRYQAEGGPL